MSFLELPDGSRMDVFGSGGGERLARESGVPFIGAIPMDPSVRTGGDDGVPVTISHPESAVSRSLTRVAMDIAARISVAAMSQANFVPINLVG